MMHINQNRAFGILGWTRGNIKVIIRGKGLYTFG